MSTSNMPAPDALPGGPSGRWQALDLLRAAAVVWMIQGHTFTALLRAGELPERVSHLHAVLHGLTAPAFLFGAGLAFGVATYPQYERHRKLGRPVWKRLNRYAVLGLLGYALQLPGGSLWAAMRAQGPELSLICRVGPLQHIALVLCLSQLAALVLRSARVHAVSSAVLAMGVLLASTAVAHSLGTHQIGVFWASYLDDRGGAHFPIFPWASFVLLGIAAAGLVFEQARFRRALPLVLGGAALAACSFAVYRAAALQHDDSWLWRTSPSYFLFRLGLLLLFFGLLHCRRDAGVPTGKLPAWGALLATHSLVAYVAHIYLLYGSPLTPGLHLRFAKSLALGQASLVCAGVLIGTIGLTYLWDRLERDGLLRLQYKRAGLLLLALSVFVR